MDFSNSKFKFQETLILVGNTRVPCLTLPYYNWDQCLFVVDNTLSIGVYNFGLWRRSCYMKIVFETSLFNWHHKTVIRNCVDKPYKTMDFIRYTCSSNSYRRNVLILSVGECLSYIPQAMAPGGHSDRIIVGSAGSKGHAIDSRTDGFHRAAVSIVKITMCHLWIVQQNV